MTGYCNLRDQLLSHKIQPTGFWEYKHCRMMRTASFILPRAFKVMSGQLLKLPVYILPRPIVDVSSESAAGQQGVPDGSGCRKAHNPTRRNSYYIREKSGKFLRLRFHSLAPAPVGPDPLHASPRLGYSSRQPYVAAAWASGRMSGPCMRST